MIIKQTTQITNKKTKKKLADNREQKPKNNI